MVQSKTITTTIDDTMIEVNTGTPTQLIINSLPFDTTECVITPADDFSTSTLKYFFTGSDIVSVDAVLCQIRKQLHVPKGGSIEWTSMFGQILTNIPEILRTVNTNIIRTCVDIKACAKEISTNFETVFTSAMKVV